MSDEVVLNVETGQPFVQGQVVQRATDPLITNQGTPADFAAQYPNPLDPTEILAMCEEITLWQFIPSEGIGLKTYTWREMATLAFVSGSHYIGFADGYCPEEYAHDGDNFYVNLKNIGVKKSLTVSDIKHSAAVAATNAGINRLVGGAPSGEGLPGAANAGTFLQEAIADLKEKEVRLGMTLVLNGWDRLLVQGNATLFPLEFDGIEQWPGNRQCTFHTNSNSASGTFSAITYDRFLTENCAKPTHTLGHPQAIQELMAAYFALSFNGSQAISVPSGNRITPGYNFAGFVNTAIGQMAVVADNNFRRTDMGNGAFQADLWALRMTHNGEPLIYRVDQFPLSYQDLAPGCTAISFEIWAKTALIIKNCCMQGKYTSQFTGRVPTTCTAIG